MERMEKQLSAVEWFANRLLIELGLTIEDTKTYNPKLYEIIQQAKEMEKNYYICSKCKSKLDEKDMQQMQNRKKD